MHKDDNKLIRRCQNGDREAFDELLNQYYDLIYRIAYKWCGDQHNAQDIAQQACIKLARSLVQFRFESSFSSWLYRLVINCAKDFYKSPNQVSNVQADDTDKQQATQSKVEQQQYTRQILEHISHLPTDLRDTVVLVFGTGLNHRQAAEQLDIKESTVSWRVHEARKLLKQTFESTTLSDPLPEYAAESARGAV